MFDGIQATFSKEERPSRC